MICQQVPPNRYRGFNIVKSKNHKNFKKFNILQIW